MDEEHCTVVKIYFEIGYEENAMKHPIEKWTELIEGKEVADIYTSTSEGMPLYLHTKTAIKELIVIVPSNLPGIYEDEPDSSLTCECFTYELWHFGELGEDLLDLIQTQIEKYPVVDLGSSGEKDFYIEFHCATIGGEENDIKEPCV